MCICRSYPYRLATFNAWPTSRSAESENAFIYPISFKLSIIHSASARSSTVSFFVLKKKNQSRRCHGDTLDFPFIYLIFFSWFHFCGRMEFYPCARTSLSLFRDSICKLYPKYLSVSYSKCLIVVTFTFKLLFQLLNILNHVIEAKKKIEC